MAKLSKTEWKFPIKVGLVTMLKTGGYGCSKNKSIIEISKNGNTIGCIRNTNGEVFVHYFEEMPEQGDVDAIVVAKAVKLAEFLDLNEIPYGEWPSRTVVHHMLSKAIENYDKERGHPQDMAKLKGLQRKFRE